MSAHDDVGLTSGEELKFALIAENDFIETVMREAAEDHCRKEES